MEVGIRVYNTRSFVTEVPSAGKSTLLQVLAGKRMVKDTAIIVKGQDVFRKTPEGIAYLGTEWYALQNI